MKKRILLVDDSMMSRLMIKKCLPSSDQYSYELQETDGGTKCLDFYRKAPYDLVLLDLTMPDMDGFETLEKLREMDPDARVVIVTADIQQKAAERVFALGALEVVKKPTSQEKMTAVLEKYL
ncbi:MAG: response regulator [Deltaproteobacteria bacterium]|nr:response regulator [Deltaproteobacteria bacterium]